MRKSLFTVVATALLATASFGHAQQDPAAGYKWPVTPWHVHQLTPTVYFVDGGGGNSGVIVGQHGVIVFDAKTTADGGKKLLEFITKITPKPVTTVILSHSDVDHVGGLPSFPKGITIIAQENDLKELQANLAANPATALPAEYFPNKIVAKNKEDITIDGIKMELLHWAPAHTSGDMMLYLPDQKILFCGDIVTANRARPLIHLEKNGSSEGWITTMKGALTLNVVQYVPGHGDVIGSKEPLQSMLSDAQTESAKIKELVAQGKSLQEIESAVGDPTPAEAAGPPFAPYSEVVYLELTKKKP